MSDYQDLYKKITQGCPDCPWKDRKSCTVPPEGPVPCWVMLIGRNPGVTEDRDGRPFIGKAGQALDIFLRDCGLERSSVYITNMSKCYGGAGDPCPTEKVFDACEPFLEQEIVLVNPEIVVTFGADAYRRLTCNLAPITKIQGVINRHWITADKTWQKILPVTHPSYWIRSGNYYERVVKAQVVPVLKKVLDEERGSES